MAYTPISTMFNTPYSTTTVLSPLTPLSVTPVSPLSPVNALSPLNPFNSLSPLNPFNSLNSMSPLSPLSPLNVLNSVNTLSPLSPLSTISMASAVSQSVVVNNDPLTIVTPIGPQIITTRPSYVVDIDTGMEDNYVVQRDVTRYFMFKSLDKWLFEEWNYLFKFLIADKNSVRLVKNEDEREKNDVKKDSDEVLEQKADYIEKHILSEEATKEVLKRIMRELGIAFYSLPHREALVMEVLEKFIKKKLKKRMANNA